MLMDAYCIEHDPKEDWPGYSALVGDDEGGEGECMNNGAGNENGMGIGECEGEKTG